MIAKMSLPTSLHKIANCLAHEFHVSLEIANKRVRQIYSTT